MRSIFLFLTERIKKVTFLVKTFRHANDKIKTKKQEAVTV